LILPSDLFRRTPYQELLKNGCYTKQAGTYM